MNPGTMNHMKTPAMTSAMLTHMLKLSCVSATAGSTRISSSVNRLTPFMKSINAKTLPGTGQSDKNVQHASAIIAALNTL